MYVTPEIIASFEADELLGEAFGLAVGQGQYPPTLAEPRSTMYVTPEIIASFEAEELLGEAHGKKGDNESTNGSIHENSHAN